MVNDEDAPTGRPAGAIGWAGLANTFYLDRPKERIRRLLGDADPAVRRPDFVRSAIWISRRPPTRPVRCARRRNAGERRSTTPRRAPRSKLRRERRRRERCFAMVPPACLLFAQVGVYACKKTRTKDACSRREVMTNVQGTRGRESRLRCRHRRRRLLRHVHAAFASRQARHEGHGVRGRRRRRRHLVLESLSRRTLRLRQLHLLLHVRQEPAAGMELVRALSGAGRDPALPRALR